MQILGLSNRVQAAVASTLKVDYVSASCTATSLAITIALLFLEANGTSQPRLRRMIIFVLDI